MAVEDATPTTQAQAQLASSGYNPWAGHVGHLTTTQEESLEAFKKMLVDAGLYRPVAEGEESKASHDDATLLRFLRARRFEPAKALKQFSDTASWRKRHRVDKLYAEFPVEEFESSKRYYPRWTGRRDKGGRPVYVYKLAAIEPFTKEIHSVSAERRYERIVALYEVMMRFVAPLCSYLEHSDGTTTTTTANGDKKPPFDPPISSTTSIIDLSSISLSAMWSLRSHLQEASRLATANYPETLHAIVVVNAPGFFGRIWGWISNWFDEVTRNKIHILTKDQLDPSSPSYETSPLFQLIDKKNIPKEYGGDLDWTFLDEPDLDEEAREVLKRAVTVQEGGNGSETKWLEGAREKGEMVKGPWLFDVGDGKVVKPVSES
ncbi:CRAL/TRIO domain-containing protein [Dendrothele bispora CBS 962.96]|uniref:CRAL/TRIO domain-containing protein n=1 Tax=Dendrothele bispora (strain CBS 962.96) TaxID=1314807 RepID=A0A4S8MLS4_DENBC|nr:CRAL/TRIO domain-containing protein [Dendrothele bispora CBS 962.96]